MAAKNNSFRILGIVTTLLLLLVAVPSVVAGVDWGSASGDTLNTGQADSDIYNLFNETPPNDRSLSYGAYSPLIGDFDDDGDNEVYISSGNEILILDEVDGIFKGIYSLNMGASEDSQAWAGYVDNNNNDTKIIASFNDTIYTLKWNGTAIVQEGSYATGLTVNTGIACAYDMNNALAFMCATNDNTDQFIIYNPNDYSGLNVSAGILTPCVDFESGFLDEPAFSPILSDIDNDNSLEYVTTCDITTATARSGLQTLQVNNFSSASDWTFTSGVANTYLNGFLAYDFDSVGDEEVCLSYTTTSGTNQEDGYLRCLNGDDGGASQPTTVLNANVADDQSSSGAQGYVSNPVVADMDGDGQVEVCVVSDVRGNINTRNVNCYDGSAGAFFSEFSLPAQAGLTWPIDLSLNAPQSMLYAGRLTNADRDSLWIEDHLFYLYDVSGFWVMGNYTYSINTDVDVLSSIGDVNDDGLAEIINYDYGSTTMSYLSNSVTNNPPTLDNDGFDYGGYGSIPNFINPICVNTTVVFNALEDENYANDFATDEERLVSNCGYFSNGAISTDSTIDTSNGSFTVNSNKPQFSCYYNTTGTFPVTIYIQDDANEDDLTQFNTQAITVNVINGVEGVECNVGSIQAGDESLEAPTAGNAALDQSVEDTFGLLTGTSDTMKLIVGFAIVIGLLISTAQIVSNPFVILSVGILGTSMLTFIGLLPKWIIVFIIFSLVIATAAKMAFGRHAGSD